MHRVNLLTRTFTINIDAFSCLLNFANNNFTLVTYVYIYPGVYIYGSLDLNGSLTYEISRTTTSTMYVCVFSFSFLFYILKVEF